MADLTRREALSTVGFVAVALSTSCRKAAVPPAGSRTADPVDWSATAMADAIRQREISSSELVTACLARIEGVNPRLNAVVTLCAEQALADARSADDALARGRTSPGPLHGVPMTIKDSFDTAGVLSTGGTKGRSTFIPAHDATVVARLKAAGAILLGKTNTPEFTFNIVTDNLVFGRTGNPFDSTKSCGGSSGGAAAVVAAQGAPFDIGSDTSGSIRQPAHLCGVVGLKPTSARVPRTGHIISFGGVIDSWTQLGPLARRVEDLELIWPLIAGNDWIDPNIVDAPIRVPADVRVRGLRVAVYTDNGIDPPSKSVEAAVQKAARALSEAGVILEPARPKDIEQVENVAAPFTPVGADLVRRLLRQFGTSEPSPPIKAWTEAASSSVSELALGVERLDQFRSTILSFMQNFDAVLCPVEAYSALPDEAMLARPHALTYTQPFSLTGQPAVIVRADTSPDGMPVGVQIVARRWREDVALALARHLETVLGGYQPPPSL